LIAEGVPADVLAVAALSALYGRPVRAVCQHGLADFLLG
jgi:hypothetical protein